MVIFLSKEKELEKFVPFNSKNDIEIYRKVLLSLLNITM